MLVGKKKFDEKFKHVLGIIEYSQDRLEREKRRLNLITNKEGDPLSCITMLGHDFHQMASVNLLVDKDIEKFRQNMYLSTKLSLLGSDTRSYLIPHVEDFFSALMSNNQDILEFFKKYNDILAYEREKYKKEIEEAKLEEEYQKKFEKLPQKYTYIKNGGLDGSDIIQSKSFKMELTIARKELFVEKGVAMLDELERDIAQIIAIYAQSNKYIPQLEKYSSIYIVKRSRMSSADINAWKAIAKQALNIDLRANKISKKLNEEYAFPFGFEILSKEDKKHDLLTDYIIGARAIIGF